MPQLSKMRRRVSTYYAAADDSKQLQRASPSLPIITRAHLCSKRNSFWDWNLISELELCRRANFTNFTQRRSERARGKESERARMKSRSSAREKRPRQATHVLRLRLQAQCRTHTSATPTPDRALTGFRAWHRLQAAIAFSSTPASARGAAGATAPRNDLA